MSRGKGIFITVLEIGIFILAAILKGLFIIDKFGSFFTVANGFLLASLSYFLGLASILIELRFLDLIVHSLKRTFIIVCLLNFFVCLYVVLTAVRGRDSRGILWADAPLCILVFLIAALFALIMMIWQYNDYFPEGDSSLCDDGKIHIYSNLGTVHTPRSVNAASVAVKEDRIPMLGINYGMILVMTIFKIVKTPFIYFTQLLYYSTGNAFVCIFIMGFMMECWKVPVTYAFFSAVVVLFATEEISVRYKLCTDTTGLTNWGIIQYPDVWMMCCIALAYFRFVFLSLINGINFDAVLIFTVICAVQWSLLAPQFSVMLAGAMGCNIVLLFVEGSVDQAIFLIEILLVFVIITLISARLGGGMFQKKEKIRNDIEGSENGEKLSFAYRGICLRDIRKIDSNHMECIVTTRLGDIVKSWFFILAVLFAYVIELFGRFTLWEFFVGFNLLVLFIGGFVLVYFVSMGNGISKMQLSRFSALAFVLSKIAWMGIVYTWIVDGNRILGIAGIVFAMYMIASSIPYHIKWNRKYSNYGLKGLLSVWFSVEERVTGAGFYSSDSKRNQNIIRQNTVELTSLKMLKNRAVYIYGTGEYARKLYHIVKECRSEVIGFIDSNSKKWDKEFEGCRIFSPQYVGKVEKDDELVIIGSNLWSGIWGIYVMCEQYSLKNIVLYKP